MAAPPKVLDRIKKLNALSTSPEANEAKVAAAERDRLMARHGVTMADLEGEVVEIADDRADEERLRLAKAIGTSRRCVGLASKRGEIGFRGRASAARAARELYTELVTACSRNCEIGPTDPGRDLHRVCFWVGFVDAVVERLLEDEVRAWTSPRRAGSADPSPVPAPPAAIVPTEEVMAAAAAHFAAFCGPWHVQRSLQSVSEDAYAAGANLGRNVSIPPRDAAPSTDRALSGKEPS